MKAILRVNAGGRAFDALRATLTKYPQSALAAMAAAPQTAPNAKAHVVPAATATESRRARGKTATASAAVDALAPQDADEPVFLDVDPDVFSAVLQFLRSGTMVLPTNNEPLRAAIVHQLREWGLLEHAFPLQHVDADGTGALPSSEPGERVAVRLPDVLVVQLCDHMTHDQGIKRHATTVTFGADGFRVRDLCVAVRRDLKPLAAKTFWQCQQTNERAMFFVSSRLNNATADLLMTSLSQQVIAHTESMGYSLQSSYVTLSPDVQHTNVRLFIHNFIFRRVRDAALEESDALALAGAAGGGADAVANAADDVTFRNFEAPQVGPQPGFDEKPRVVAPGERVGRIWD